MKKFSVKYLPDAIAFLEKIEKKATEKLLYNISKSQEITDSRVFKKLTNSNIWEFRAKYRGNEYRLFAFWDRSEDTLVICTHGILKKLQKTPGKEIAKAEKIRKQYLGL